MQYPSFPGAILKEQTPQQADRNFKVEEIMPVKAAAAAIEWKPIDLSKYKILFGHDQYTSGSCVAQTWATIISRNQYREEGNAIDVSASMPYQLRSNRPDPGMVADDIFKIATDVGSTLEMLMPSQRMSDGQMDEVVRTKFDEQIGKILTADSYFHIPFSVDAIAAVIESDRKRGVGVPVMLWFKFNSASGTWWRLVPITSDLPAKDGHSVTGIEYGLYNGEKAIVVQESAGKDTTQNHMRIVTESYLKKHIFLAVHFKDKVNNWRDLNVTLQRPKHTFAAPLEYSPVYNENPEVVILQDILKYEAIFDHTQKSTGYYGNYTSQCVEKFQIKHGIPTDGNKGRRVGPKTLAALNKIYG